VLDPEVEWHTAADPPDSGVHYGHDGVAALVQEWVNSFEDFRADVDKFIDRPPARLPGQGFRLAASPLSMQGRHGSRTSGGQGRFSHPRMRRRHLLRSCFSSAAGVSAEVLRALASRADASVRGVLRNASRSISLRNVGPDSREAGRTLTSPGC
jgi:hypothetical protein